MGVNFAGNPALALPFKMPTQGQTNPITSLQLIGPRFDIDASLLGCSPDGVTRNELPCADVLEKFFA